MGILNFWPFSRGLEAHSSAIGDETTFETNVTAALKNSAMHSSMKLIANAVSSASLDVVQRNNNNEIIRYVYDDPIYKLVNQKVNPYQNYNAFIRYICWAMFVDGAALVTVTKVGSERNRKPYEIYVKPIGSWQQQIDEKTNTITYHVSSEGRTYTTDEAFLIHNSGPTLLDGVSVITAASNTVEITAHLNRLAKEFARTSGTPRGIVTLPKGVTAEIQTQIANDVDNKLVKSPAGIMTMTEGAGYIPLSSTLKDSQYLEQRKEAVLEVARFFTIPPSYLGVEKITKEDVAFFNKNTVAPFLDAITAAFTAFFFKNNSSRLEFYTGEYLNSRIDAFEKMPHIQAALGNGGTPAIISRNEARKLLGLIRRDDPKYDEIADGGYANAQQKPPATDAE